MDSTLTFRIDSESKEKMAGICSRLGMTPSAALTLFVNAFIREGGMPFPVTLNGRTVIPTEQAALEANKILHDFAADYKRMAE